MQSRVDELTSDAHLKMTFIEFMEAIARAADYLSLAPPSEKAREAYLTELHAQDMPKEEKEEEVDNNEKVAEEGQNLEEAEGADMTDTEHTNQPLHKKVENIIPYLLAY